MEDNLSAENHKTTNHNHYEIQGNPVALYAMLSDEPYLKSLSTS